MKDERREQVIYNNAISWDKLCRASSSLIDFWRRSDSTGIRGLSLEQPIDYPGEKVKT
jgi:hypothetical protein